MLETKSIEKVNLPDGKYYGTWCAYTVTLHLPDWKDKPIKVNNGIRGISNNEIIEIKNGWLYIVV